MLSVEGRRTVNVVCMCNGMMVALNEPNMVAACCGISVTCSSEENSRQK